MGPEILIPLSLFLAIFGIFYLFVSTRNKERLALIEKGVDASIFMKGKQSGIPTGRIIILNLSLITYRHWCWRFHCTLINYLYFITR